MGVQVHATALVENGVELGDGTSVWDSVHIRAPARVGRQCIIGEKTYVAYAVSIGDRVKINAFVYICAAVTIESGVLIAAGTVFTNDRYPRATNSDLSCLRGSGPDEHTLPTLVREGATIGAKCVIGCDLEIGRFAMVGMGSVVTRSVADFHLVAGNPAATIGVVCRCGHPILDRAGFEAAKFAEIDCETCGLGYAMQDGRVSELCCPSDHGSGALRQA